jgi:putative Mg2+ transporter-C (MgtC) family protein
MAAGSFATDLGYTEILVRLGAAGAVGLVVGLDRELRNRAVGLRTSMLVAIGAALFGVIGVELAGRYNDGQGGAIRFDPSRIVEGIITGIGFLGAGAIIRDRQNVVGVTTAASVWVLGGVGLACGFGLFAAALVAGGFLVFVLTVLGVLTGSGARSARDGPPKED